MTQPFVVVETVRDEEEGLPLPPPLGELPPSPMPPMPPMPPPRAQLRGLDREFTVRFGVGAIGVQGVQGETVGGGGGGVDEQQQQQEQQHKMNYTDLLKAQRAMKRGSISTSSDHGGAQGGGGGGGGADAADQGGDGNAQQPNFAVASAVAKLRRRALAAKARENQQPVTQEERVVRGLSALDTRGSCSRLDINNNSAMWENAWRELEEVDEDGHFASEGHGHDAVLPWYAPPVQRQRWGEDQILPHVNWGDLFFDLFYVAMAYNLGVMMTSATNSGDWLRGIIYYVGAFGALWNTWEVSMFYESRYTSIDYAHRMFEVIRYLCVSLAVCHVKPIELMADPKSAEVLLFTSFIFAEALMHLLLCIELYFKGLGDRKTIQNHTLYKIKFQHIPTMLGYLSALITAIVLFVQPEEEDANAGYDEAHRHLASTSDVAYEKSSEKYESAAEPLWKLSDLPLTLTAASYLLNVVVTTLRRMKITNGKHGNIRERYVPNNVDYAIHRYGEWIMLMIGEGILSLLIVETVETRDYYIITAFGILTVIFIQILKFESEPAHAEAHAMWRNLHNSMCYSYLIQVLSMGLILFGVTYKVFLKAILKGKQKEDASGYTYPTYEEGASGNGRMLAASPKISDNASADLFAYSLSVVLLSLELMCLTHAGVKKAAGHLVHRPDGNSARPHLPVIIIALIKAGIILFTLTMSSWTTDPAVLTICGCLIVFSVAITRVANFFFIHRKEQIAQMLQEARDTVRNAARASMFGEAVETAAKGTSNIVTMATSDGTKPISLTGKDHVTRLSDHPSDSIPTIRDAKSSDSVIAETDLAHGRRASDDLANSFDAIVVADLSGIIMQVNETAVTLFAYASKHELIGKNLSILVGGGHAKHHDGYLKAFKSRVKSHSNPDHKILGQQRMLHGCRADGTEFPCIIGIKMVSNNTRIAGYIRDMSKVVTKEQRKVSYLMEEVEEIVKKVVNDHAFDAIIAFNDRGTIEMVNQTAVTEFGYTSRNDLVGENLSVLVQDITPQQLLGNSGMQRHVSLTRKDGTTFQSIVASKKIEGTNNMFASYIRNIDPVMGSIKGEKCE